MPPAQDQNTVIVALLKKNAEDMQHLHDCVHEIGDQVKSLTVYFDGQTPAVHIMDHAKLKELLEERKESVKTRNTALISIATSVITAFIVAVGAYSVNSIQKDLKLQIQELVKQVPKK